MSDQLESSRQLAFASHSVPKQVKVQLAIGFDVTPLLLLLLLLLRAQPTSGA
jgi:hypothetical protein